MQAIVNKANNTVSKFLDDDDRLTSNEATQYFLVPNVEPVAMPKDLADSVENAICKWANGQLQWFLLEGEGK